MYFDNKTWSQGVTDDGNTAVCVWGGSFVGLSGFDQECYAKIDGVWMDLATDDQVDVEMADDLDDITKQVEYTEVVEPIQVAVNEEPHSHGPGDHSH